MLKKGREKRKKAIRAKIFGTKECPRLSVFRSNKFIYGQIINDEVGRTLVSYSGHDPEAVGQKLAQLALKKKIKKVVFDRGGFKYHGRVKILAEAARKGGLEF